MLFVIFQSINNLPNSITKIDFHRHENEYVYDDFYKHIKKLPKNIKNICMYNYNGFVTYVPQSLKNVLLKYPAVLWNVE